MNASANLMKKCFKIWANLDANIRMLKFIRKIGFNFSLKFGLKFDTNLLRNFANFVLNFSLNSRENLHDDLNPLLRTNLDLNFNHVRQNPNRNLSVNSRKISYKSSNLKSNFTSSLVLKSHKISSSLHQILRQNINPHTNLVQISKADKNANDSKFNEQILLKPADKRS